MFAVRACVFSPDGRHIVSSNGTELTHWDAQTGTRQATVKLQYMRDIVPNANAFSPDARRYAGTSGLDNHMRVWDVQTGNLEVILKGHSGWVRGCAFSPDGQRIVSASWDGTLRLWNVPK
jgi:WD40 repeat protein